MKHKVIWILKKEFSSGIIYFMDLVRCPFLKTKLHYILHVGSVPIERWKIWLMPTQLSLTG